jgi:hypothetical protein
MRSLVMEFLQLDDCIMREDVELSLVISQQGELSLSRESSCSHPCMAHNDLNEAKKGGTNIQWHLERKQSIKIILSGSLKNFFRPNWNFPARFGRRNFTASTPF